MTVAELSNGRLYLQNNIFKAACLNDSRFWCKWRSSKYRNDESRCRVPKRVNTSYLRVA
jgi:hypothetical protein